MSKITDDDVTASVLAYGKASSSGCRDKWLSVAGMRAAAKEIERRVLARVKAEPKSMHEPVSWAEVHEMCAAYHEHERVPLSENAMEAAGNTLLARRAAATRAEVVVTWELAEECIKSMAEHVSTFTYRDAVTYALGWLADRLNGKSAAPVDPRKQVVVTEGDVVAVTAAHAAAASSIGYGMASIRVALQVFADRLNGQREKPSDPRVEIVQTRLKMTREVAEDFLALLDEAS